MMTNLWEYSLPETIFSQHENKILYWQKNIFLLSQWKDWWLSALCFNICMYIKWIHSIPNNCNIEGIDRTLKSIVQRVQDQAYIVFTNNNNSPQLDAWDQSAWDIYFKSIKDRTTRQWIALQQVQLPEWTKEIKYQAIQEHLARLFEECPTHTTYTKTLITWELFGTEKYPDTLDTILSRQLKCNTYASYREYFKNTNHPKDGYGEWSSITWPYSSIVFQDSQSVFKKWNSYDYTRATTNNHYDPLGEDWSIQTAIVQWPAIVPQLSNEITQLIKKYLSLTDSSQKELLLQDIIQKSFPVQKIR